MASSGEDAVLCWIVKLSASMPSDSSVFIVVPVGIFGGHLLPVTSLRQNQNFTILPLASLGKRQANCPRTTQLSLKKRPDQSQESVFETRSHSISKAVLKLLEILLPQLLVLSVWPPCLLCNHLLGLDKA